MYQSKCHHDKELLCQFLIPQEFHYKLGIRDFSPLLIFSITSIFLNPELFFKYSINWGLCSLVEYPTVIII
jgi:hypothetical protein